MSENSCRMSVNETINDTINETVNELVNIFIEKQLTKIGDQSTSRKWSVVATKERTTQTGRVFENVLVFFLFFFTFFLFFFICIPRSNTMSRVVFFFVFVFLQRVFVYTRPAFTEYYQVNSIPDEPKIEKEDDTSSRYVYKEITQDDFSQGTYRITQSGTYTVVEDITFDLMVNHMQKKQEL